MDKIIRNIDEYLWRTAKSYASLSGRSLKQWVEEAIAQAILRQDSNKNAEDDKIRIGVAISKTGHYSIGAKITQIPNYIMWIEEVNARGGLYIREYGKQLPIELIEYDDESDVNNTAQLVERLILKDKVDLILAPWGTAAHFAAAPVANKFGYPLIGPTVASEKMREESYKIPNFFGILNMPREQCKSLVELCIELGIKKVAVIYVGDRYGMECVGRVIPALGTVPMEIAVMRSYELGMTDASKILYEIQKANVDALICMSYPEDTNLITRQCIQMDLNFKLFYCGVGVAYSEYRDEFGKDCIEGVCGAGAWNPKVPYKGAKEYFGRFIARWDREPDRWASAHTYASLQVLEQAIDRAGSLNRAKLRDQIASGTFETIIGPVKFVQGFNVQSPGDIGQWQDGEFEIICPKEKMTSAPIYPKPVWQSCSVLQT